MLKNKFGMTKILVLVLSVLMLVSLVACNKADGPSTDDMNAAIQAAIDAANAEQAAKEAALAASIAADKAAQEAKDAALAESIAKEKAENDAALKKAQEEAKAAADAAAAASKAAKEAADKAAKDAADAAAKAAKEAADKAAKEASEAAKKAQEAAEKQASELAAALEAAKAEALKAAEEAAKAQAEASKAIEEAAKAAEEAAKAQAEASKAKEEAAVVSSQLAETTVVPETTVVAPAETTVAPETTTEAPAVPVDKTEVLAAFSKLKTEYTYTKQDMYKADDYAELVLLFDKASLDMNNAATVEAATAVLETLKVDAAAIRSVENAAADVATLVNDLGDIETAVFTTQAERVAEAVKAYGALKVEYADYLDYNVKTDRDGYYTVEIATELGINVADLAKAEAKIETLAAYMTSQLYNDMKTLYAASQYKLAKFDPEVDTNYNTVESAYYKVLVLSIVNGGDFGAGLPIDWEYLIGTDGKVVKADGDKYVKDPLDRAYVENVSKVYDEEKPTAWFTVEELLDVMILPVLDIKFSDFTADLIEDFGKGLDDLEDIDCGIAGIATEADFDDIAENLANTLEGLSFVDDYKGNVTYEEAQADAYVIAIKAYIEAMNEYLDAAKTLAITAKETTTDTTVATLEATLATYEASRDAIDAEKNPSGYDRWTTRIDQKNAEIKAAKDALVSFTDNVNAAALLTFEEMLDEALAETKEYKDLWVNITDFENVEDEYTPVDDIPAFLNAVLENTIEKNFVDVISDEVIDPSELELLTLIDKVVADLEALRLRVSPYVDDYDPVKDVTDIFDDLKGDKVSYIEGDDHYYTNTAAFLAIVKTIDDAIAEIEASTTEGVDEQKVPVLNKKGGSKIYFKDVNTQNYALVEELSFADIVKDTTLWTTSKTSYPVEYIYTAAEQVANTVVTKYVDTYKAVNTAIVAIDAAEQGDDYVITTGKDAITDEAYDAILATTAGTLKSEVEKVASDYQAKIDALDEDFSKNSALTAAALIEKLDYKHDNFIDIKVKSNTTLSYAKDYDYMGYYDEATTTVLEEFKLNFYALKDGIVDIENTYVDETKLVKNLNLNVCKVVQLWNLKLEAAEDIADLMATYKNSFVANIGADGVATGTYTLKANKAGLYYYDGVAGDAYKQLTKEVPTGEEDNPETTDIDESKKTVTYYGVEGSINDKAVAKSAAAIAYEAELDALLKEYTDKIMGLTLSNVSYSIAKAEEKIAAYKTELFGTYETVKINDSTNVIRDHVVTANNNSDKDVMHYRADSKIFSAYNTYILGNTYGTTRVPVKVEVEVLGAAGLEKTYTISNAYYLDFFTISAGKAPEYDGNKKVKDYGTVVDSISVVAWKDANDDGVKDESEKTAVKAVDGKYFAEDLDATYLVTVNVSAGSATTAKVSVSVSIDGGHAKLIEDKTNTKVGGSKHKFTVVVEDGYMIEKFEGATVEAEAGTTTEDATTYSFTVDGTKKNEVKVKIKKMPNPS